MSKSWIAWCEAPTRTCAGHFLARAQTVAVLRALAGRVSHIDAGSPRYQLNNITRRIGSLAVSVQCARNGSEK